MVNAGLRKVRHKALELPRRDRAQLAHDLLTSLDGPDDTDATDSWGGEVARRLVEIEQGLVAPVEVEEVLRRVRARIQPARS